MANFFVTVLVLFIVAFLHCVHFGEAKCLCSVTKNGEYCGVELNELNSENECPKKIFFCGDSNRDQEAIMLVDCPEGRECDVKTFLRNACLKDVECKCPKNLMTGKLYCGDLLQGANCHPNVTFSCPYLSMLFLPTPKDACLFGCKDGACLPATETTQ